jgi:hypothetical protein
MAIVGDAGRSCARGVRGLESLTLKTRVATPGSADSFTSTTMPRCRRRPLTGEDLFVAGAQVGEKLIKFQVYDTGLTAYPRVGDSLVDASDVTYQVRALPPARTVQGIFNVLCIQNK